MMVVLVHPTEFVGGLMTGGLGATDVGNKSAISGASLQFFIDVCSRIRSNATVVDGACFAFPPHAALETFNSYLMAESNLTLILNTTLVSVSKKGSKLQSITIAPTNIVESDSMPRSASSEVVLSAPYFMDASYEGDLVAAAGVSYSVGREGVAEFNESLAGVMREPSPLGSHQFRVPVNTQWPNGSLLPMLQDGGVPGPVGAGDSKIQAYNFRLTMTTNPSNRRSFPKPTSYDPSYWELARRWIRASNTSSFSKLMNLVDVGEGKTDTNNNGPISTDFLGGPLGSWLYPNASPAERRKIWQAHYEYTAGFFWFLQHDPDIPSSLSAEARAWGLTQDEFTATDGWTPQLYVREARRMRGVYIFKQQDREYDIKKPDSIGLFSYNIDSHNCQRFAASATQPLNEGDFEKFGGPLGQIPYRCILPVREEATNLLVPVPLSATHLGYGTLRLEPQYMIIGESAGVAISMAWRQGIAVQDVDIGALQDRLRAIGLKIDL